MLWDSPPCLPGTVHLVYLGQSTLFTRDSPPCLPGTVHLVYPGQSTLFTWDSPPCLPGTVHLVYLGQSTLFTWDSQPCLPVTVHLVYNDSAHTEVEDPSLGCMNGSNMYDQCRHNTKHFILPAPPLGGLPISQDGLDRMKLVYDHTIPIILPSGKNILVD